MIGAFVASWATAIIGAMHLTDTDLAHLRRCVELAREALDTDNDPFGSLLVDSDGVVRFEDRNRTSAGDETRHPEFEIARWAAENLTVEERAAATVYTSGEHCPMCAAAHAWVGLGRIVYASSSAQLTQWRQEWELPPGPVAPLPINDISPGVPTAGPAPELIEGIRELHRQRTARRLGAD
jgi:tRNA(Arg) A34 adenosine deaminase TadA